MTNVGRSQDSDTAPEAEHSRLASPALFLALAFALGAGLTGSSPAPAHALFLSVPSLTGASAACLLGSAILLRLERDSWAIGAMLTGFVFAGTVAALLFSFRFSPDHVSHLESWGIDLALPVSVEGTLETDCILTPTGFDFDLDAAALGSTSEKRQMHRASGRIRVQVKASRAISSASPEDELRAGDRVQAMMRLRRPHVSLNPGSFDFRERAANVEDLYWEGTIEDPADLHRLATGHASPSTRVIQSVRERLRRAIDRIYPPWSTEGRDGAVLKAVLLGERSSLDSATIDHFRASGLYHLLVIAGLHVGLIAALVLGLFRLVGLIRRWRNSILMIVLTAYALIVEQRAPTLRATLMILIFIVAQFLGRDHSALNAVGLAALALLITRPAWLFEAGFQLSFAAALLIVGLAAPVLRISLEPYRNSLRHLEDVERDTALQPRQAQFRLDLRLLVSFLRRRAALLDRHPSLAQRLVSWPLVAALWIGGMVLFSAVLQGGLLLPMVEQFHRVTLAGVGLNALALPLMAVLLAVAVPTVLLATVAPSVAAWPAKILTLVFHLLFAIAEWPHLPPWLSYRLPSPPLWVAVGFAVSLIVLAVSLGRHRVSLAVSSVTFLFFALTLLAAPFAPQLENGVFALTALDCGSGEAVFLALPDRATVLVGAGGSGRPRPEFASAKRWDPGENVVSPYLWSRRIKALDVVVVASAAGNLDGFVSILQNFRVGELWYRDSDAGLALILEEAGRRRVTLRAISPGERLSAGETVFDVLASADEAAATRGGPDPLILRVASGQPAALVASSASFAGQQQLLESKGDVRTLVLATGRHVLVQVMDANVSSNRDPGIAQANGTRTVAEGESMALGSSTEPGYHTFATDRDGAVTVEMKSASVRISAFASRP